MGYYPENACADREPMLCKQPERTMDPVIERLVDYAERTGNLSARNDHAEGSNYQLTRKLETAESELHDYKRRYNYVSETLRVSENEKNELQQKITRLEKRLKPVKSGKAKSNAKKR